MTDIFNDDACLFKSANTSLVGGLQSLGHLTNTVSTQIIAPSSLPIASAEWKPSPTDAILASVTKPRTDLKLDDPRLLRAFRKKKVVKVAKPRSLSERLMERSGKFKNILNHVAMHLDEILLKSIHDEIDFTFDADAWDEDDPAPSDKSFNDFIALLVRFRPAFAPQFGIGQDGRLMAAWVQNGDRLILELPATNEVIWIYSGTVKGKSERIAGRVPLERLGVTLPGAARWFSNA